MYLYHMHIWCPCRTEEGIMSLGTRIMAGCESAFERWKMNPVPLQEQKVFIATEPSLQPPLMFKGSILALQNFIFARAREHLQGQESIYKASTRILVQPHHWGGGKKTIMCTIYDTNSFYSRVYWFLKFNLMDKITSHKCRITHTEWECQHHTNCVVAF